MADLSFLDALRLTAAPTLEKTAGFGSMVAANKNLLRGVSSGGGAGMLVGSLAGAGINGARKAYEAHEEGAGLRDTAMAGVMGAGKGALYGGAAGGLGGAALGARAPQRAMALAQGEGIAAAGARFGQRQMHGLTGALSGAELEGVRGGAYDARKALGAATDAAPKAKTLEGAAAAIKEKRHAARNLSNMEAVQDMGLTSLPGLAHSVRQNGLGRTAGTLAKEQFQSSPLLTSMMGAGAAYGAGQAAFGKPELENGEGRGERIGKTLGTAVGGLAGSAVPLVGNVVVGEGAGRLGQYAGRAIDRARGVRPRPRNPLGAGTGVEETHVPIEHVTSPAAAGQAPEIG